MKNPDLQKRVEALGLLPTEELEQKIMEFHAKSVPDSTIRKAHRELDKARIAAARAAKEAAKAAAGAPSA